MFLLENTQLFSPGAISLGPASCFWSVPFGSGSDCEIVEIVSDSRAGEIVLDSKVGEMVSDSRSR